MEEKGVLGAFKKKGKTQVIDSNMSNKDVPFKQEHQTCENAFIVGSASFTIFG